LPGCAEPHPAPGVGRRADRGAGLFRRAGLGRAVSSPARR
jgi:hypothetical protein